jgi:hypothetical protein
MGPLESSAVGKYADYFVKMEFTLADSMFIRPRSTIKV